MNCAFLNILTTMNDLYGSHNCPFSFGIDLISWDELGNENIHRFKKINMIPDEEILGNGMSVHEIINADFKIDEFNGISLKDGLTEIYNILKKLNDTETYLIGYGLLNFDLKVLNEHFERVLNKQKIEYNSNFIIDVETIAKKCCDVSYCGNYSLKSVLATYTNFNIYHRLTDKTKTNYGNINATRYMLYNFIKFYDIGQLPSDIVKFINEPQDIKVFQMGKYKGAPIEEIFNKDKQYFSWILKNKHVYENDKDLLVKVQNLMNLEEK